MLALVPLTPAVALVVVVATVIPVEAVPVLELA